jgi:hypothetical protein
VTNSPDMLTGVSGSWKMSAAAEMVMTSLKMPHIDRVTTEDRWSRLQLS